MRLRCEARAALPASSSKPPAATPSARRSRSRSAARGKRQQSGRRAHAAALRPEASRKRAAPAMLAAPAPQPTHNRRAAAGRAFPLGRSCGPAPMLAGHALAQRPPPLPSLHDPRHRSCTGSRLLAALPDLHALRHCSGKAAAAGSGLELRNETESSSCAWPNSAHNSASVIRNCKQLRITPVMRITGHAGQRQQAAKGYELQRQSCCSCPQRSGPQLLHAAAAARAGLRSVVGGISARSCCTLLQQHGPGKAGRRPRAPPPPPPTCPPSASSRKAGPFGPASLLLFTASFSCS